MDKFCEDCVHNEVCQYGAIPPHKDRCNDKDTLDDLIPEGEWVLQYRNLNGEFYTCSQCERMILIEPEQSLSDYPYCHHCGTRMKGGVGNG